MIKHTDIIVDLQAGDTGKGKVAHALAASDEYTAVVRYNGGGNAGHTIYHDGKRIVTHQVPVGVFYDKLCVIGPGCVVNLEDLIKEIDMLKHHGFTPRILIDKRAHVTTKNHLIEDQKDTKIGTTKKGIGPTYRDKHARTGKQLANFPSLANYDGLYKVADTFKFFRESDHVILCEGAQGFQLDIDWGDYPYVTSSHCTSAAVAQNGFPPSTWRKVYGIMKAYETYVGNKEGYSDPTYAEIFAQIQEVGGEFGATTGRKRQVRWLNLDEVKKAVYINDVTDIIINKLDVLETVGHFKVIHNGILQSFNNVINFQAYVELNLEVNSVTWSRTPEGI